MRIRLLLLCLLAPLVGSPAEAQTDKVLLRWKLPSDSLLTFQTVMRTVESDTVGVLTDFVPQIKQADYTLVLSDSVEGQIGVEMLLGDLTFAENGPDSTETLASALRDLQTTFNSRGVMLKGAIDASGAIQSFWLPQEQRNLVSLFLALPADSVAVGDVWEMEDMNLVSVNGLPVTKGYKSNRVRLESVETVGGSPVAVLVYALHERVDGPSGMMAISFTGRARFDIARGRWLQFSGEMDNETTFLMGQSGVQAIVLHPVLIAPDAGQ